MLYPDHPYKSLHLLDYNSYSRFIMGSPGGFERGGIGWHVHISCSRVEKVHSFCAAEILAARQTTGVLHRSFQTSRKYVPALRGWGIRGAPGRHVVRRDVSKKNRQFCDQRRG